ALADQPDGLAVELPGRGTITLRRKDGGTVAVTTEPKGVPVAEQPKGVRVVDPAELAKLPNAADALRPEDVPEVARVYVGGGDAKKAPGELVAVLGDTRFRCPTPADNSQLAFSADGKLLAVPGDGTIQIFSSEGVLLRRLERPRESGPVHLLTFSP